MFKPKASVLITVKDDEQYISRAIESILDQTCADWELLVVDDGSTDGTNCIIRKYCIGDSRINLIESKHIGRAKALNLGVSRAKSNYIVINDSDDWSLPDRLKIQLKIMEENDYAWLAAGAFVVDEKKGLKKEILPPASHCLRESLLYSDPIVHSSIVYRKKALISIKGFNENLPCCYDYDVLVRLASRYNIGSINDILCCHLIHSRQHFLSKTSSNVRMKTSSRIALNAGKMFDMPVPMITYMYYLYSNSPYIAKILLNKPAEYAKRLRNKIWDSMQR